MMKIQVFGIKIKYNYRNTKENKNIFSTVIYKIPIMNEEIYSLIFEEYTGLLFLNSSYMNSIKNFHLLPSMQFKCQSNIYAGTHHLFRDKAFQNMS